MSSWPHDALGQTYVEMPTGKTARGINVKRWRGGSTWRLNTLTWVPCWSRDQKIEPPLWVTAPSCEASREWVKDILLSWHLNGNNCTSYSAVLKTTTSKDLPPCVSPSGTSGKWKANMVHSWCYGWFGVRVELLLLVFVLFIILVLYLGECTGHSWLLTSLFLGSSKEG